MVRFQTLLNPTSFKHELHLFDKIPQRNTSLLNRSIQPLQILKTEISRGPINGINEGTIATALKACKGDPLFGLQIHGYSVSSGFDSYLTVSNSLISMYSKCGQQNRAMMIFESLEDRDIVSWNTVLSNFCKIKEGMDFAIGMHLSGVVFDAVTYTTSLAICSDHVELLWIGIQLHSLILRSGFESNTYVGNALITMYARWGCLVAAEIVFDEMSEKDLISWNAMLSGYAQDGNYGVEAMWTFVGLVREGIKLDHVSLSSVIAACGHERSSDIGRQVHGLILRTGYGTHVSVCNVLISFYSKCGVVEDSNKVFESMVERNVISWTTMISVSEENAIPLFNEMRLDGVCPNEITFVGLIHALPIKYSVIEGEMIHGFCIKTGFMSEMLVSNSLITMYTKFKSIEQSRKVFDEVNSREIASWNTLISGYTQNGLFQEALETFLLATLESKPNHFTFGSVLSAIGAAEPISVKYGQRCHSRIIRIGLNTDPVVSGALLDMYAKCGSIEESRRVFEEIPQRGLVAWTSIISAHARHGDFEFVLGLFDNMEREGIQPDSITFLAVLASCSRKGMVDTGLEIFNSMVKGHQIEPSEEIYSCVVDMLGRAGRLKEAEDFLSNMPTKPGLSAMQSLLGACKMHGNVEMGTRVADALMEMEPMDSGTYVLMSNMYAEKGEWEKVATVRRGMRDKGVKKEIGFSWVDVGGDAANSSVYMHGFSSDYMSHPQSEEIYKMVECLRSEMKIMERKGRKTKNAFVI